MLRFFDWYAGLQRRLTGFLCACFTLLIMCFGAALFMSVRKRFFFLSVCFLRPFSNA